MKREQLLAVAAMAAVGLTGFSGVDGPTYGKRLWRTPPDPAKKCLLPACTALTTHNGGYCSAEHCKEHRAEMKKHDKGITA